jgi:hypothetical protein
MIGSADEVQLSFAKNARNSMALDEYLESACERNRSSIESRNHSDPWQSPLFEFVWLAKGHPEMKDLTAGQALRRVERWLKRGGAGTIAEAWVDRFCIVGVDDAEDARAEFIDVWGKIKFPPGCSPLEAALERAEQYKLEPPDCPTAGYGAFISLAGHLQVLRGPNAILLPCHKLASLLGLSHMTIARYREWAVKDGHLRITRPHRFDSREATEFRFDVARYPALSGGTT